MSLGRTLHLTMENKLGAMELGDAGLDLNRNHSPRDIQKLNFRQHVLTALASSRVRGLLAFTEEYVAALFQPMA